MMLSSLINKHRPAFLPFWRWLFVVAAVYAIFIGPASASMQQNWVDSQHLKEWYNEFDLCMIYSKSNSSIDTIMKGCEAQVKSTQHVQLPVRCRAGNSWPSKSEYCSASDIPFYERKNFQRTVEGLDDPSSNPLAQFFRTLGQEKGALLVVGDSVMQQFFSAIACELEREKVWKDPGRFTNMRRVNRRC